MFEQDELIQVWIVHHLARLGEAVARLSPSLRKQYEAPWKEIIGMRNILVHESVRIDPEAVWPVREVADGTLTVIAEALLEAALRLMTRPGPV